MMAGISWKRKPCDLHPDRFHLECVRCKQSPSLASYMPNVWLGTTVENQPMAEQRLEALLAVPAALHFASVEPLLGPVNLRRVQLAPYQSFATHLDALTGAIDCPDVFTSHTNKLGLVIVGGESGGKARPMNPEWVRDLQEECKSAGTPFFFKQWGEWSPMIYANSGHDLHRFDGDGGPVVARVAKKVAGRMLDGREYSEMPKELHS
jgi:protein gp37